MGLADVPPDDLLPILVVILVVIVISFADVVLILFLPSRAIPAPEEYTFLSASNPEEPKPLPSLGDRPTVQLSIIVPAYNETERLKPMIDATLEHLRSLKPQRSYEIIIVDDGSSDKTSELALKISKSHAAGDSKNEIRVVTLKTNRGKGGAVKHGIMHARGERVLFVDADGATRFSDLESLWQAMNKAEKNGEPVIAIGSRAHMVNSEAVVKRSAIRNFLMRGFHTILRVLGVGHIGDTQCGFKLFNRVAAQRVFPPLHLPTWIFDVELLLIARDVGIEVLEIPVHWQEIPGSKLNVARASLSMLRDLLIMRGNYLIGRWSTLDFQED